MPGLGIADRDDERKRGEQRAADRAPARVVHELEQEEVRQQQHEQARVAVEEANDVPPRHGLPPLGLRVRQEAAR